MVSVKRVGVDGKGERDSVWEVCGGKNPESIMVYVSPFLRWGESWEYCGMNSDWEILGFGLCWAPVVGFWRHWAFGRVVVVISGSDWIIIVVWL